MDCPHNLLRLGYIIMGNLSQFSDLMKIPKRHIAYKLMAHQITVNKHIEALEKLLSDKTPVVPRPVMDIAALRQEIDYVLENSPDNDVAESIAIMLCRKGFMYDHNTPHENNGRRS